VWLVADAGTNTPSDYLSFADGASGLATKLGLNNAKTTNVQHYALGGKAGQAQALPGANQQSGSDGTWDPSGDAGGVALGLIGDPLQKTGMNALVDVDLFNILCIPATMNLPDNAAAQVATAAASLCTTCRAFYILDPPQHDGDRDTVQGILNWLDANATLRSRNAALYFPRVDIADPLNNLRLRASAPSGTMAGVYASTDASRGVWKAPAGTGATLSGVQSLEYKLTDAENGVLNPLAINCLRNFPVYGIVSWGARTLFGADQMADDYKYIPVRRFALFLEESLYQGTQWVVFEPNADPLWAQIRLNIGSFMQNLFRQGAFQGTTPAQAYFVQCDNTTTTQNDINLGVVNIVVGFAPLKPAEFVVIQIQQMAGQTAS
jgi:phage tail sheath protein FI